jgi:hypothetical protein
MPIVTYGECHIKALFAECHYAECHGAVGSHGSFALAKFACDFALS